MVTPAMATKFGRTAIVLDDFKEAALYFEYLIPIGFWQEFYRLMGRLESKELKSIDFIRLDDLHQELLPPSLQRPDFVKHLREFFEVGSKSSKKFMANYSNGFLTRETSEQAIQFCTSNMINAGLPSFLAEFRLEGEPVVCSSTLVSEKLQDQADLGVTLTAIKVIDADRATWRQVIEFRRDADSTNKLRRLRLFACDNYAGKSKEYVEDDILNRLAEHHEAVRKWGFGTKTVSVSALLNSKLVRGGLAGSLISALCGKEGVALAATATGVVIELASITIELARRRFALREAMASNPVSYISSAISTLKTRVPR